MTIQSAANASPGMILLTRGVDQLTSQDTALQGEVSSGVVADGYAGLGDNRFLALNLQPQITRIGAWSGNVTAAQNSLGVAQTAMSQIAGIATRLHASLVSLQGDTGAITVSTAALQARQSLTQLASLLNTRNGTQYVFAGNASQDPPLTDPSSITGSAFFQTVAASVAAVGTSGAAAVQGATLAAAADNTPGQSVFSAGLSTGAAAAAALGHAVAVGEGDHAVTGYVATQGGAPDAGSTGSPIRDLMRALAVVGSLDKADAGSSGFAALVAGTGSQMAAVSDGLTLAASAMGQTQARLTTQATTLGQVRDALTAQLEAIKGSDPATVSAQLVSTQNQLQASYGLIADMKKMSLAAYL